MIYFFVEAVGIVTVFLTWLALVCVGRRVVQGLRREHTLSALYLRGYVLLILVVVTVLAASVIGSILSVWSR